MKLATVIACFLNAYRYLIKFSAVNILFPHEKKNIPKEMIDKE